MVRVLIGFLGACLPALAVAAEVDGSVAWKAALPGQVAARPAVSADGRIAVATDRGLVVVDAAGKVVARADGLKLPMQPGWVGDALWFRTDAGWRTLASDVACPVDAESFVAVDGRPVFAPKERVVACDAAAVTELAKRRGEAGKLERFGTGWLVHDLFYVEVMDASFKVKAARALGTFGVPTAVVGADRALVTTVNGRVALVDASLDILWEGPRASAGEPVPLRSGAVVLLSDSGVSVVDPPRVAWSVPARAGVRAAAALEGGAIAVLERSGHVAVLREGKALWSKTLAKPGSVLVAHPDGLLLVVDGKSLVALRSARPERSDPSETLRLESPASTVVKGSWRVQGPAFGSAAAPVQETVCARKACDSAGKRVFEVACGEGCASAVVEGALVVAKGGVVERRDASGRVTWSKKTLAADGAVSVSSDPDGAMLVASRTHLAFVTPGGTKLREVAAPIPWRSGPLLVHGSAVGTDVSGALVSVGTSGKPSVLSRKPQVRPGASLGGAAVFSETACFPGDSGRSCWSGGRFVPGFDPWPRASVFGVRYAACGAQGLCVVGLDGLPVTLDPEGVVSALVSVVDGSLAGLVDGRELRAWWPDGTVRWSAKLSESACEGATLDVVSAERLVVRACGVVAAYDTGVRARR